MRTIYKKRIKTGEWSAKCLSFLCLVFIFAWSGYGYAANENNRYLMLVTYINSSTWNAEKLALFDKSSYEGVAVMFLNPYDTKEIPSAEEMTSKLIEWKKTTKKDLWPWVFLNRMLGPNAGEKNPHAQEAYFAHIKGADLDSSSGTQNDFLLFWRNSLRAAKNTGAPGVVVDLEFYLNYAAYNPTILAKQAGISSDQVIAQLKTVGAKLADAANSEYSNAKLWFLFTDLGESQFIRNGSQSYYPSPAYIVMGLLEEIKNKGYKLQVISGGEVGLGYCHTNLEQLRMKITHRANDFAENLQKYNGILNLAGTLTLWSDQAGKSDAMKQGGCGKTNAQSVEDLQPFLEEILKTYRYNWIYASGDGSYYAFHPRSAPRFDTMIQKAKQNVH